MAKLVIFAFKIVIELKHLWRANYATYNYPCFVLL